MPILGTVASSYAQVSAGSYYQIATTTLTATASTISFTSITSSYKHLQLRFYGQTHNSTDDWISLWFNNDTSNIYTRYSARGEATTPTGGSTANTSNSLLCQTNASSQTSYFSGAVLTIPYYSNTNIQKASWSYGGFENGGDSKYQLIYTIYATTTAISSVYIGQEGTGGLKIGTKVSLYGIG